MMMIRVALRRLRAVPYVEFHANKAALKLLINALQPGNPDVKVDRNDVLLIRIPIVAHGFSDRATAFMLGLGPRIKAYVVALATRLDGKTQEDIMCDLQACIVPAFDAMIRMGRCAVTSALALESADAVADVVASWMQPPLELDSSDAGDHPQAAAAPSVFVPTRKYSDALIPILDTLRQKVIQGGGSNVDSIIALGDSVLAAVKAVG